jgi:hypothetical protein
MSRLLAAALLLSAVSIAHAQNCVPIAPDATDGGAKISQIDLQGNQDVSVSRQ